MKNTRLLHRGSRQYKRIFNLLKNLKNAWLSSDLVIQGKQKPVIFVDRDLIGELLSLVDELKEVEKDRKKAEKKRIQKIGLLVRPGSRGK